MERNFFEELQNVTTIEARVELAKDFAELSEDKPEFWRRVLADQRHSGELRTFALYELIPFDEKTEGVAALILSDETEPIGFRANIAEKAAGYPSLITIAKTLLNSNELVAELAFWCLYALAHDPDDGEAEAILERYLTDTRSVDTGMGSLQKRPATVAMEARWALAHLRGADDDPEWMTEL